MAVKLGYTISEVEPNWPSRSPTTCFAPSPTPTTAITDPTPITMPSMVSAVRDRFVLIASHASSNSDAIRTPSPYSFVRATTGSRRAALTAG